MHVQTARTNWSAEQCREHGTDFPERSAAPAAVVDPPDTAPELVAPVSTPLRPVQSGRFAAARSAHASCTTARLRRASWRGPAENHTTWRQAPQKKRRVQPPLRQRPPPHAQDAARDRARVSTRQPRRTCPARASRCSSSSGASWLRLRARPLGEVCALPAQNGRFVTDCP